MKNKWLILSLILSLAINLAAIFTIFFHWFDSRKMHSGPDKFGLEEPMNRRLRPTPEQLEMINTCRLHFREQIQPLHEQMRGNRKRMVQLLMQSEIDTLNVLALQDSISELHQQIQRKTIFHLMEQRQYLDENQYQAIFRMMGRRFMNPDDDCPPPGRGRRGFRNRRKVNK